MVLELMIHINIHGTPGSPVVHLLASGKRLRDPVA